jgi:Taurine catabolism dioxygenase TauD, TfdA family
MGRAWRRADVDPDDWLVALPADCRDEIGGAVAAMRTHPLPLVALAPDDFPLPRCRALMAALRQRLDDGLGFAVLDRLPLEEMSLHEAKAVYWLLSSMVARPVAQKLDGTMIYDVLDTGKQALPGSGVRPDSTNIELLFHNDNSYNRSLPEYVGLLTVRPARSGGRSKVISFAAVHDEMERCHPGLVPRLYRPFWFDRQREFFPGEAPVFAAPLFERGARGLRARLSLHQVRGGYAVRGEAMDAETAAALDALAAIFADERLWLDFDLAPGQIEYVHNRAVGHSRTAFTDHDEPDRRRHLVRLWLRDHGHRSYPG